MNTWSLISNISLVAILAPFAYFIIRMDYLALPIIPVFIIIHFLAKKKANRPFTPKIKRRKVMEIIEEPEVKNKKPLFQKEAKPAKLKNQNYKTVIDNLKAKGFIDESQYLQLSIPTKKPLSQELLIEKLVTMGVITPTEPLDQTFKDFKDDLGSLNATGLVLFINALRTNKKGIKEMTPIPAKAFPIPANILFMIIIGMALFIVIVFPNLTSIEKGIGMSVPGGSGSNPLGGIGGMFNSLTGKH